MIKKLAQFVSIAALFLIPFFPLIVANDFFFPFITGKAFFFRILVEIAFAGWIILAFYDEKYRPKVTPMSVAVTLFTLIVLAADLLGVNPMRSIWSNFERMEGWLTIIHLWAFYMTATSIFGSEETGRRWWNRWIVTSLYVATIVGVYGIVQLLGWAEIHQGSSRIDASLGNAAYMAVYMLIHAFLAAYVYTVAKAGRIYGSSFYKWAMPVLAVVFAFLVFETATRGTILGMAFGLMLALIIYAIFAKQAKKGRLIAGGAILLAVVIGIVFWTNRDSKFVQSNETLQRLASISWSESKTQARGYVWPMAIKGALERPVLGWGQENFNYIFNANYNPKMWNQEQWFDRAHSVYLDWLVASGFLGLIAYLSLYVLLIIAVVKSSRGILEKSILLGLIGAYAVHNVFVFDNLSSYLLFFAILGFAGSDGEGKKIPFMSEKPAGKDVVEYVVAPIILVLLVLGVYFFNTRPIMANTRLINALVAFNGGKADPALFEKALAVNSYTANQEIREQILSYASQVVSSNSYPGPTKQAMAQLALENIDKQIQTTPNDARAYTLGGIFMNGIGNVAEATKLLEKAYELSPGKQSIAVQLAGAYVNGGKTADAVALLKKTYESAPENSMAKYGYAKGLIMNGEEAEARRIFENDPAIFDTLEMAQFYAGIKQYVKSVTILKKLVAADPKSVQLRAYLANMQFAAGQSYEATKTLRDIEKTNPELKGDVDAAIKVIEQGIK